MHRAADNPLLCGAQKMKAIGFVPCGSVSAPSGDESSGEAACCRVFLWPCSSAEACAQIQSREAAKLMSSILSARWAARLTLRRRRAAARAHQNGEAVPSAEALCAAYRRCGGALSKRARSRRALAARDGNISDAMRSSVARRGELQNGQSMLNRVIGAKFGRQHQGYNDESARIGAGRERGRRCIVRKSLKVYRHCSKKIAQPKKARGIAAEGVVSAALGHHRRASADLCRAWLKCMAKQ